MTTQSFKKLVGHVVPDFALALRRRVKRYARALRDRNLSPAHVFSDIYENNLWGGKKGEFCSGEGSSLSANIVYCDYVKSFIADHHIKSVLDIGCGDFQVSRNIVASHFDYIGVDVVAPLIERNQRKFANDHISFRSLDVIKDELPRVDLVLIREVLQHLSNQQISAILAKVETAPYVIITEYQPASEHLGRANIDKPHGMDTRIWNHSGVYIDQPPFAREKVEVVLEIPVENYLVKPGERLVSYLLAKNNSSDIQ